MNTKQTNPIGSDAIRRIAELEAINDTLREALSSKNAHIAMLEERLLTMSIELASSRAREDEQNLIIRRRSSQVSMMSEDGGPTPVAVELMDDCIRSAPASSFSSSSHRQFQRRFSLPSWVSSSSAVQDQDDSMRSLGSAGGVGGIIGNIVKLDRSDTLRVDFPTGGRQLFRISDITVDYTPEEETCGEQEEQEVHDDEEEGQQQSPQRR
eukprot:scaffold4281_cov167-Skeletonema_menzelii.AAC.2